jgi:glycosyltransferase involved in cell wall biosynthesis
MSIKVAAFTGSKNISSRRFRVFQYVKHLKEVGVLVNEHYSTFGSWPPINKLYRPVWLLLTLADRILPILRSYKCDVVLFQRELVSTLLTLELFSKRPRVLDVDDAIWLQNKRANRNIIKLVKNCDGVICGNDFIYNFLKSYNSKCITIPTSVDIDRFCPLENNIKISQNKKILGWSGLSSGFKYLYDIEDELYEILEKHNNVVFRIISDRQPFFKKISNLRIEYIKWTPENEVKTIQTMTIGIMPIDDTEWSKGKCSYKMLLYMSCAIPVVVSNFGMNKEVLDKGTIGLGSNYKSDWIKNINYLLDNEDKAVEMGKNGRKVIKKYYSLSSNVIVLANFLKSLTIN